MACPSCWRGQIFRRIRNEAIEAMPDGTLFPVALQRYDSWVIREACTTA
jgi:hypothetical protein